MKRRRFLRLAGVAGWMLSDVGWSDIGASELRLEPWTPGTLDIHHLAYGRGNSTFVLCPDGTTMLIDAGATEDTAKLTCDQRPDGTRSAGEWIASYLARQIKAAGRTELDYAIATHIHPDHINALEDVNARVPICKLVDRGYPSYDDPPPLDLPFTRKYLKWVKERDARGSETERAKAGSLHQIRLVRAPTQGVPCSFFCIFAANVATVTTNR